MSLFKQNIYNVRKSIIRRLIDMGYQISPNMLDLSFQDFLILYNKDSYHIYEEDVKYKDETRNILVYFEMSNEFKKPLLDSRLNMIAKRYKELDKLFIVLKTFDNTKEKKRILEVKESPYENIKDIEILNNVYPFDISRSMYYPHKLFSLNKTEIESVKESYKDIDKFQKLKITDPLSIQLGTKKGDIVYVERRDGTKTFKNVIE